MTTYKTVVIALSLFSTLSMAHAKSANVSGTILRIPLYVGTEPKATEVSVINRQLAAKKIAALPKYIEITSDDKDVYKKLSDIDAAITAAMEQLGQKDVGLAYQSVPGDLDTKNLKTCYLGEASQVADLTASATDRIYSDQYSIIGSRYKANIVLTDDSQENRDYLNENSKAWKNFSGKNDDVLIVSSVGDDGTDINESTISRCK